MRRRWAAIPGAVAAIALSLAACVTSRVSLPILPVGAGPGIAIQSEPVVLDPSDPGRTAVGDFTFAGGVSLTSNETSRLHGLSDLEVQADGSIVSVSDDGDLFTARLALDPSGRLVGLTAGTLRPLTGPVKEPLQGKEWGDAEGVAFLPGGAMLVSFERHHRIWLYPEVGGGTPTPAPIPGVAMTENDGMEGLAAAPNLGPSAYWVGVEPGTIWLCHLQQACDEVQGLPRPPPGYRLSALTTGPGGELIILHHSYIPAIGSRIIVTIVRDPTGAKQVIGSLAMAPPMTIDNFEGVAVAPRGRDGWRLYLLVDDNFSPTERTLMMAFDWTPPR